MNTKQLKKQLILNIPYIILGLLATNLGEAWRIAAGVNASEKVQSLVLDGVFATAFLILCRAFILLICWWELPVGQHSGLQYT